jgi:hypothetical protein
MTQEGWGLRVGACAQCLAMLALDVVLYGVLAWYLDNVLPREWGTVRPWHFPLQRAYWFPRKTLRPVPSLRSIKAGDVQARHEEAAAAAVVRIRNLSKTYQTVGGPKQAVRDLSLDMYEGMP